MTIPKNSLIVIVQSMKKRYRSVIRQHHERWMVSYADFMTLLFAFFVVLYSLTTTDSSKLQPLSVLLEGLFDVVPKDIQAIQIGDSISQSPITQFNVIERPNKESHLVDERSPGEGEVNDSGNDLETIIHRLENAFEAYIEDHSIEVNGNEHWIELSLTSEFLFASGSTLVSHQGEGVLLELASVLKNEPHKLRIEGHTDDRPLQAYSYFPSNWELSAVRATTIVRWLVLLGVNPHRLSATGYSSYQPVESNLTKEGRSRNRRIVVLISNEDYESRKKISVNTHHKESFENESNF